MNTEEKEKFVSGELDATQKEAFSNRLENDVDLLTEMREHCALDRALGNLLDENKNADLSATVMQRLTAPKKSQCTTKQGDPRAGSGRSAAGFQLP